MSTSITVPCSIPLPSRCAPAKPGRSARADVRDGVEHEWTPAPTTWFRPNWCVDITGTLERKLAAFACFEIEVREHPHHRSERALRALAEYFGATVGVEHAERFVLVRNLERL
jgi:LmbE family N-acetylglucosaminyl deacetylase